MSYKYDTYKQFVYTDKGSRVFLSIYQQFQRIVISSGAVTLGKLIDGFTGDNFEVMACADRLIELGEAKEVTPIGTAWQDRVIVPTNKITICTGL